jgi:Zn-dependent protease/CBS domain-containing protein
MRQSMRVGRVAGIDIGVHWSVLVIAALLAYGLATAVLPAGAPHQTTMAYTVYAMVVAVLFLVGLLAHELAHALVARHYRIRVRRITLWLLGGVSELDSDPPSPRAELLVAAAGPLTSLALGAVAWAATALADAAGAGRLVLVSLAWLAGVNIVLGLFNLLPGAPLDGGRVLRALVWRVRGDRDRAQLTADHAGVALGMILAGLGLFEVLTAANLSGLWLVLLGWFLISASNAETAGTRLHRALDSRTVRDIMAVDPVCGYDYQTIDAFVSGIAVHHPHRSYPVVDLDGRLVGMARLAQLGLIPAPRRAELRLRAAATPIAQVPVLAPDDPAFAAATRLSAAQPLLAVAEHGHLVGVVGTGDVTHAIELAELGFSRPADRTGSA